MTATHNDHEFLAQVRRDQDDLREVLGSVQQAIGKRLENVTRVAEMLCELSTHLEKHFQDEETAGLFDQLIERAPRYSDQIEELKHEHQELREAVRALADVAAESPNDSDWWDRLEKSFQAFSQRLLKHEHCEATITQDAYTEDLGSGD